MKVVIDKNYEQYRTLINRIPTEGVHILHTFCDNRNWVYLMDAGDGKKWVLKKFKRPTLANCIIYTWFRTNKAKRSFLYAYRLLQEGISTARPIAYIEINKNGFFHTGYYISEYLPYKRLDSMDIKGNEQAEKDFMSFVEQLFEKGIVNYDLNPSNILIHRNDDGTYQFSLVDINRIRFKVTDWRKHIHAFLKCISFGAETGNKKQTLFKMNILSEYCIECGINLFQAALNIHLYRRYKTVINILHRLLKKIIAFILNKK
jgi:hypothetical protein